MFQFRLSLLRTSFLTLAGLLLASGVTWAHGGGGGGHGGGGGGHGGGFGGGHGGGMHAGGFGHAYGGGIHHGGIGYGGINHGLGYSGLYGRGYGLGYGFGFYGIGNFGALGGYGLGYGRGYAASGFGYGMGYPYYGFGFSGYSYPYYGYGGGYPYLGSNYGFSRGALPYASGGPSLYGNLVGNGYTSPLQNSYANYYPSAAQTQTPKDDMAHLLVVVPENAELWFNGAKTKQTGTQREFVSPTLKPDKNYSYEIKARWMKDGKPVEQVRTVHVQANDWKPIDFTKPEASVKKSE